MGENAARSASGREGEAQPLQGSGEPCRGVASAVSQETLLGSREAGHIGTSEKASQVAAPVGNGAKRCKQAGRRRGHGKEVHGRKCVKNALGKCARTREAPRIALRLHQTGKDWKAGYGQVLARTWA